MVTWKRAELAGEALRLLPLTSEEGFVLSRLDVPLTAPEVSALTGFPPERAEEILAHLAQLGAVEGPPPADEPAPPEEEASAETEGSEEESQEEAIDEAEESQASPEGEASYRKIYEASFRGKSLEERIAAVHAASASELMALCLDAEPPVISAVLAHPASGLQHARFAARWHPTAAGLEAIGQRGNLIGDPQVQRALLRNVHLSELLTRRILSSKRMVDAYKISIDTDVPERARQFARGVLRSKFGTSQGEERAGLIAATEGRVLPALAGLSLDGRAASILCARSYTSPLFVQNLARFGACPPQLLAHLLKQPLVRRQQHLKNMLLQHPNMPAEAKRKL